MWTSRQSRRNAGSLLTAAVLGAGAVLALSAEAFGQGGGKDKTPPAAVTDLAVVGVTSNTISLAWTATGDDGNSGTASLYRIRYMAGTPITEQNWDAAKKANPGV